MVSGYPDFEGGKQKIYLVPEWASKEAVDKSLYGVGGGVRLAYVVVNYTVSTGKTLYIVHFAFGAVAGLEGDAELNQICRGLIVDATDSTTYLNYAKNGGDSTPLSKPIVFPSAHICRIGCYNHSNHNCDLMVCAFGYEV